MLDGESDAVSAAAAGGGGAAFAFSVNSSRFFGGRGAVGVDGVAPAGGAAGATHFF